MNTAVNTLYAEYLEHTGGDKAAAASLALAAVLVENGSTPPLPTALTVAQTAKRLGVTRKTIYEMCQGGRLRSFRLGRVLRVPAEEIARVENKSAARGPVPRFPELFKRHC
jgi:excisionase family DNA binding protein